MSKRGEEKSNQTPRGANAGTGVHFPIVHMTQGKNGPRKKVEQTYNGFAR